MQPFREQLGGWVFVVLAAQSCLAVADDHNTTGNARAEALVARRYELIRERVTAHAHSTNLASPQIRRQTDLQV